MNQSARNSRSQTGTPGVSRTQSVAGGHRASALHTVRRVLEWADSEKGTRVLTLVIKGFETRFGHGSNLCEVDCEDPCRQPRGYTKVSQ